MYNKGIEYVYMTDKGVVRDEKHYSQKYGFNINFRKYIVGDTTGLINISNWRIKKSRPPLPDIWIDKTFRDLGFYKIPKSDFYKYT